MISEFDRNGDENVTRFGCHQIVRRVEPVFVPRAPDADDDDGWVMAYVYDAPSDRSDVVILAAQDFSAGPLATIHLPQRVPFGFHGNWLPDDG